MMSPKTFFAVLVLVLTNLATGQTSLGQRTHDPSKVYRVKTRQPVIKQDNRPWVDASGKQAFVGKLRGRDDGRYVIVRADGKRFAVSPDQLTKADRDYARLATEPRVKPKMRVLIGVAEKVLDGDTIRFRSITGEKISVRLNGIDAPEKEQSYGDHSMGYLRRIKGYELRVEYEKPDNYGRILGDVYVGDRWVNYEMARAGLAWHYTKYSDDPRLASAEAFAQEKNWGIWSEPKQIAPWDYRAGVRTPSETPRRVTRIKAREINVLITRSGSHYHTSGCPRCRGATQSIPLHHASSAYEPCSTCRPPVMVP